MRLATRYGLVGIAALALLSTVHWFRDKRLPMHPAGDYALGVLPNLAAAVAITFVLLGIWSDRHRGASYASVRRALLLCASISGAGLFAWEILQITTDRLVFDAHDLGATLVGLAIAAVFFRVLTPRTRRGA